MLPFGGVLWHCGEPATVRTGHGDPYEEMVDLDDIENFGFDVKAIRDGFVALGTLVEPVEGCRRRM